MTNEEKDRLIEILTYLYFTNVPEHILESSYFWETIRNICAMHKLNYILISKAVRILTADENKPQEDETYFLLHKIGLTVRPIRTISGIYWQKQVEFQKKFESKLPVIRRRITDIPMKECMKEFIKNMYDISGIYKFIDYNKLKDVI